MSFNQDKRNAFSRLAVPPSQKLQKVLAMQGLGSRRTIEQWIQARRCTVNGQTATLGMRVSAEDKITLDGQLLSLSNMQATISSAKLLLYYKPAGEICSASDPQGRRTVFDSLPSVKPARWVMLGRLDYNTQGLLLFTTDGVLSHRVLHPSYEIEREYAVRVHGLVTRTMLNQLQQGVLLEDKIARFSSIIAMSPAKGANHWYRVILKEGRHREVRRLWTTQGVTVSRLLRIRFGPIVLPPQLHPGQFVWLPDESVYALKHCVGLHT